VIVSKKINKASGIVSKINKASGVVSKINKASGIVSRTNKSSPISAHIILCRTYYFYYFFCSHPLSIAVHRWYALGDIMQIYMSLGKEVEHMS
jgi:hypothetical protein